MNEIESDILPKGKGHPKITANVILGKILEATYDLFIGVRFPFPDSEIRPFQAHVKEDNSCVPTDEVCRVTLVEWVNSTGSLPGFIHAIFHK